MRGNLIQIRVGDEEKVRIRGRATAAGFDTVSEYLRELALGNVKPMISSTAIPMPERKGQAGGSDSSPANEGAKEEPAVAKVPPSVAAEIAESRLKDDAAREAFIARRKKALFGAGNTTRVAQSMAEDEWRNR